MNWTVSVTLQNTAITWMNSRSKYLFSSWEEEKEEEEIVWEKRRGLLPPFWLSGTEKKEQQRELQREWEKQLRVTPGGGDTSLHRRDTRFSGRRRSQAPSCMYDQDEILEQRFGAAAIFFLTPVATHGSALKKSQNDRFFFLKANETFHSLKCDS